MTLWTDDPNETLDNLCKHYQVSRKEIASLADDLTTQLQAYDPMTAIMALMAVVVEAASYHTMPEEALDVAVNLIDVLEAVDKPKEDVS